MTMKPIEEAMEDDVFEGDSANDIQNSPEPVYDIPDDIWTDIWWTAVWRLFRLLQIRNDIWG